MTNKKKQDVKYILDLLEKVETEKRSGKIPKTESTTSNIGEFDDLLKRSKELISDDNFIKNLSEHSIAITETCKISFSVSKDIDGSLMTKMLLMLLTKLEKEKIIKINI